MVKPVSGFMTKFDRFFEKEIDAILNETEFILRDKLANIEDVTVDLIFSLLNSHREEFMAYLTALRKIHNGKETNTDNRLRDAPQAPHTPQGKSHRLNKPPPPNV